MKTARDAGTVIEASDDQRGTLKRRGLIAGAAALTVGLLARQTAQTVAAAYNFQGDTGNTALATTILSGALGGNLFALTNTNGVSSGASALNAQASAGIAVQAASSLNIGVDGSSGSTIGVRGQIASFSSVDSTIAVYGNNPSTGANPTGVYGQSNKGTGVFGQTNAANQYGVLGTTTAANSTAVAGIANTSGSSAFSGGTTNASAFAGVFQGTVVIQGKLVVSDPSYKSGALQHPDGSHRLVYCVESPESWIEDFGNGQLAGGKAEVTFDPDFAAVVHTDTYHIFLTASGDSKGLYVANKRATGFEVREQQGGTSTLSFSWRVVVKPKSMVKQERLGKFTMPNLPLPDVGKLPKAPTK